MVSGVMFESNPFELIFVSGLENSMGYIVYGVTENGT